MKLAIILILGMVSCFDIGQAADGASVIKKIQFSMKKKIKRLNKHCQTTFTNGTAILSSMEFVKFVKIGDRVTRTLQKIQAARNRSRPLIRQRSQHCYFNANEDLQKWAGLTGKRLQNGDGTVLWILNIYNGKLTVEAGKTLINELNGYLPIPTRDDIKEARLVLKNFRAAATTAYDRCTESPQVTRVYAAACFRTAMDNLKEGAKMVLKTVKSCIKTLKEMKNAMTEYEHT